MPLDGAFSPLHWLIVGVVALLVLGPDQLPKVARQAARLHRELAQVREHLSSELRDVVAEFDIGTAPRPNEGLPDGTASPDESTT
jgi:Sec-independent protein translocase protein TatA